MAMLTASEIASATCGGDRWQRPSRAEISTICDEAIRAATKWILELSLRAKLYVKSTSAMANGLQRLPLATQNKPSGQESQPTFLNPIIWASVGPTLSFGGGTK
jgi:hypothetical protein